MHYARSVDRRTTLSVFGLSALGVSGLGLTTAWPPSAWAAEPDVHPYSGAVLKDLNADTTSLRAQARGQRLVVVVMKGHYCALCRRQMKRLQAMSEQLRALDAKVVGLNHDSVEANRAVAKHDDLKLPILSDRRHEVISALGLWLEDVGHALPAIVVFDRCGSERGRQVGRNPDVRPEAALMKLLREVNDKPCQSAQA